MQGPKTKKPVDTQGSDKLTTSKGPTSLAMQRHLLISKSGINVRYHSIIVLGALVYGKINRPSCSRSSRVFGRVESLVEQNNPSSIYLGYSANKTRITVSVGGI